MVRPTDVRYVDVGEVVCVGCFNKRDQADHKSEKFDVTPTKKEQFKCAKCGFVNKFKIDSQTGRSCSYCGAEEMRARSNTAADLLEEVSTME